MNQNSGGVQVCNQQTADIISDGNDEHLNKKILGLCTYGLTQIPQVACVCCLLLTEEMNRDVPMSCRPGAVAIGLLIKFLGFMRFSVSTSTDSVGLSRTEPKVSM